MRNWARFFFVFENHKETWHEGKTKGHDASCNKGSKAFGWETSYPDPYISKIKLQL
jgi:hypothetical protein